MLALLLVGVAVTAGIALRAAAAVGTILLALMWLTSLPLRTNPAIDEHVIYAAALIALAAAGAGRTWSLAGRWERLLASTPAPAARWLR